MRRASPPGPAPGETMRDPLTPPSDYVDHAAARRIVVGVLLTMLLAALDQVMVATALATIAASLGDVDNMSWVVTANPLCATAATPPYGKLSDIHGRRAMLLLALTWGGRRYGWASPQILALFVASLTLWTLFAWRVITAKEPFIPLSVLRDGAMRVGTAAAFFAVGVVIALRSEERRVGNEC